MAQEPATSLRIRPDASSWRAALSVPAVPPTAAALSGGRCRASLGFRSQLALPTDRPVVISGHQAEFWHPGILAKYLSAEAAARAFGAAAAWLTVDQDHNDPWEFRFPVRLADDRLATRVWRADGATPSAASDRRALNTPTCRQPAVIPAGAPALAPGESFAARGVEPGLNAIRAALVAHSGAPNAAEQTTRALADLLAPFSTPGTVPLLLATRISRTDLFAETIDRMRRDPAACATAYNAAVRQHPGSRIAEMTARDGNDWELPLWYIPPVPASPRLRVFASTLASIKPADLAPRALLMTGLLRWMGCDLFIHGTGGGGESGSPGGPERKLGNMTSPKRKRGDADTGDAEAGGYDVITEAWFRDWLGAELSYLAVVTATLRLSINSVPITPAQIAQAQWRAHRAQHDPALLNDPAAAERKRALVDQIRSTRNAGGDALPLYRQMHAALESARAVNAGRLVEIKTAADTAAARRADAAVLAERTWAFPLYESEQLGSLKSEIAGVLG